MSPYHLYFVSVVICVLPSFQVLNINLVDAKEVILERKLSLEINPGCTISSDVCSNGTLLHIRSDSESDSLHFIWNFIGSPTLLLARTNLTTKLKIDWTGFITGQTSSISFDPPNIFYSFGASLTTIWTYDDDKDDVQMDRVNQTNVYEWDTNKLNWEQDQKDFVNRSDLIRVGIIATSFDGKDLGPDGYVKIKVQVRNTDGYADILPYMRHNGNSSQVDISLNQVDFDKTMTRSTRIALGYQFVQQVPYLNQTIWDQDSMKIQKTKALDDEHSPGVFEVYSLRTSVLNEYDQSYLEWKPICYIAQVRDITDSIDVHVYPLQDDSINKSNILWSYYGDSVSTLIVQSANISFGTQGDGFFNKTGHLSWTYMTGYGPPPSDSVSLLVILTLAVGLGVPSLIIIIAIIYLFTKRLSTPKDDLLLGR